MVSEQFLNSDEQSQSGGSVSCFIVLCFDGCRFQSPKEGEIVRYKRYKELKTKLSYLYITQRTLNGKKHKEMAADTEGVFRLIQSIPSPKAEPFKQWMTQVAALRLGQMQDPEMSI